LGTYDGIIGQDWLEIHKAKVDYYENKVECMDDEGILRSFQGDKILVLARHMLAMKSKNNV
jgi:hypothetical protein